MKNFLVLLAVAFATLLVSCNRVKDVGFYYAVELVSITTGQEEKFGIKFDGEIVLYPQFPYYGQGISDGSIYFSNDKKVCYLFDLWGEEILTKRKSNAKELDFDPVPIVVKDEDYAHQILDPAERYFGNIFYPGKYYLFSLADGNVYALFAYGSRYFPFGSYQKFFPGNTGFSYKRANKWGATAAQMESRQTLKETISEQEIFPAEYDEIIEVVKSRTSCVWFARKGNNWVSRAIGEDGIVRPAAVDTKLLNRVRNMRIQNKAKGRRDGMWTVLIPGQRIGTKEASVVFF